MKIESIRNDSAENVEKEGLHIRADFEFSFRSEILTFHVGCLYCLVIRYAQFRYRSDTARNGSPPPFLLVKAFYQPDVDYSSQSLAFEPRNRTNIATGHAQLRLRRLMSSSSISQTSTI